MAVPKETVWECKKHTQKKHELLKKYLQAWYAILASRRSELIYIDGFAGPGTYAGGQDGSPIVALKAAREHRVALDGKITFHFVEQDPARAAKLDEIVEYRRYRDKYEVNVVKSTFSEAFPKILDDLDAAGKEDAAVFAFVDPFGIKDIEFTLLARLMSRDSAELFILYARDALNRFIETDEFKLNTLAFLGVNEFCFPEGSDRLTYLQEFYRRRLKTIGKYVDSFEMRGEDGRLAYDLFFASNHPKGFLKMKQTMWAVDKSGDFSFSDKVDPAQESLFAPVHTHMDTVKQIILDYGAGRTSVPIEKLTKHIVENTRYLPTHMKKALVELEKEAVVSGGRFKADGSVRKLRTFPKGTLVDFSS